MRPVRTRILRGVVAARGCSFIIHRIVRETNVWGERPRAGPEFDLEKRQIDSDHRVRQTTSGSRWIRCAI